MSIDFYFDYKGHSVKVCLADFSAPEGRMYHSYLNLSFYGRTHWYRSELGVEFQSKFLALLKQIQPDEDAYNIEEGRKGTTTIRDRSNKNDALAMLLALFMLTVEDKEFSIRNIDEQDINSFLSVIQECFGKFEITPESLQRCNELFKIHDLVQLKKSDIHKEIAKLEAYLQKYLTTPRYSDLIKSFYHEVAEIVKGKITFTPKLISEIAISINNLYKKALEIDKNQQSDFVMSIANLFEVFIIPLKCKRSFDTFVSPSERKHIRDVYGTYSNAPAFKCLAVAAIQKERKDNEEYFWFNLACQLVPPNQIPVFINKFSKSELTRAIRSSRTVAFFVLQTPALCRQFSNNELRSHCDHSWPQEEALIILNILRPRATQGDYIWAFNGIKRHPIVLYKMIADPSLRPLLNSHDNRDYYVVREILGAYAHLISELDSLEDASQEIKDFLAYLLAKQTVLEKETQNHELSSKLKEIFSKLRKKADLGFTQYQLIVASYYLNGNLFTARNLELACKYYLLAALQESDEALQELLEFDTREGNSTSKYTLGKIYLNRLDTEKAYNYFSQVTPDSQYYNEAMFECGNIQYGIHKNKSKALNHFSSIDEKLPGKNYLSPVLVESCRERLGTDSALTDIYAIQANRNDKEDVFVLSGVQFPKNKRMAHQLFGCTKDKKVTLEVLQKAWTEYKSKKTGILGNEINIETLAVYNKANSTVFNDIGRYRLIREYVLRDKNRDVVFCLILKRHFGEDFFTEDSCFSHETQRENNTATSTMPDKSNKTLSAEQTKDQPSKDKIRTTLSVIIEPGKKEILKDDRGITSPPDKRSLVHEETAPLLPKEPKPQLEVIQEQPRSLCAAEIKEFIYDLEIYIQARDQERKQQQSNYHTFWGHIFGCDAKYKISGAEKMLKTLRGEVHKPFDDLEMEALRNSRLGIIIAKYENKGLLPEEFLLIEESKNRRDIFSIGRR